MRQPAMTTAYETPSCAAAPPVRAFYAVHEFRQLAALYSAFLLAEGFLAGNARAARRLEQHFLGALLPEQVRLPWRVAVQVLHGYTGFLVQQGFLRGDAALQGALFAEFVTARMRHGSRPTRP